VRNACGVSGSGEQVNLTLLGAVEPVTSTGFYFDKVKT